MKFIDLFGGIGGFRRGLELCGHECVGFCELDKFAIASYTSMHLITEEQMRYLETLDLRKRQKEILKEEYRNGEWYANDIRRVYAGDIPEADCWCFGFPCQDISVAGKQLGFTGNRSSLFFRVMYLLGQLEEEKRPAYLFIENVKNLLSVNGGWDFARLLIEMDRVGYDAEWQILNSKYFGVPQNRERCFIIGHLRGRSTAEVFPVEGADGENSVRVIGHRDGYRRNTQIFNPDGITEVLSTCQGGGREHHTIEVIGKSYEHDNYGDNINRILGTGEHKEILEVEVKEATKLGYAIAREELDSVNFTMPRSKTRRGRVGIDIANTLDTVCSQGIFVRVFENLTVYAVWYPKKNCYIAIRKLTPKECFRLQGWSDDYFDKAQFVNSDKQLFKQAGNGVTVNVVQAIGSKMKINCEVCRDD